MGADIVESAEANLVFALLALLVLIPIFFVDKRLGRLEIAVGIGILAVLLLTWLRLGSWEARTHLFEYALVAALVHEALLERRDNGRRLPAPALLALIISILLGWLDEGLQSLLPNRVFDPVDVAFQFARRDRDHRGEMRREMGAALGTAARLGFDCATPNAEESSVDCASTMQLHLALE